MKSIELDWFEPAMQGSLHAGIERLLCLEESKLALVKAIKQIYVSPIPHGPDRISLIHQDIKTLDKSLRLRLGMLPMDRPQAWFRHSPAQEKGPIARALNEEPVFARFDESRAAGIRHLLPELWKSKQLVCDAYDPTYSLWGKILLLNRKLHALNQMPAPFQDILLDELPEALPDELQSPSLLIFATTMSGKMKAAQRDLESCYQLLWSRSESFLYALHVNHLAKKAKGTRDEGSQTSSKQQKDSRRAEDKRYSEDLARRRPLSPIEEALRFMNFGSLPIFGDLRTRYRMMAQALHPDRGGNEERFKMLTLHYQVLLKQLRRD